MQKNRKDMTTDIEIDLEISNGSDKTKERYLMVSKYGYRYR